VLPLSAQGIEIPISPRDTTEIVRTIKVEFERPKSSNVNVNYKNILESLTEDQINNIIITFKESNDASLEMSYMLYEALVTFNSILEERAFMENKVIHQADVHYSLSESEVKRSLRMSEWMNLLTYGILFFLIGTRIFEIKRNIPYAGYIELDKLGTILAALALELFGVWYVARPVASILLNRDYEIIKFLLQGA